MGPGDVPKFDRAWIATILTAQVAAGTALGIAAQVFLVSVNIGYVMPFFGLELLDMARGVADFNLSAGGAAIWGEPVGRRSTHYAGPPVRASTQRKAEAPERRQRVAIKPRIGYNVAHIRRLDFD